MKKLVTLITLSILLAGLLTACSRDTTIEDYLALESEFRAFSDVTEFNLTAETAFDLLAVDGAFLHVYTTHIRAGAADESMQSHRAYDSAGAFVSEIEYILTGGAAYTDMNSTMSFVLHGMSAYLDIPPDITNADILDGTYTHMRHSDETFADLMDEWLEQEATWNGIYGIFTEETLGEYLSRDSSGIFRIEILGEAVDAYIEAVLEEIHLDDLELTLASLVLVADINDDLLDRLHDDFPRWLRTGDLTDARLVIERWKSGEYTYHQNVELYIPGRVSIAMDITIVVGESAPITAPSLFLTELELAQRIQTWMIMLMMEAADMPSFEDGVGQDPALVGLWLWDQDNSFEYIFIAVGTGLRGWHEHGQVPFQWGTTADGVLIITDGINSEHWEYYIEGDVLTISSLDVPGVVFSYIRSQ